ncbi:MAG: hypothetical protein PHT84_04125 [Candidatus Pacebacteria bacterium]|nr:hypothetical protein [Candidatus Paceibacterota bacterium]
MSKAERFKIVYIRRGVGYQKVLDKIVSGYKALDILPFIGAGFSLKSPSALPVAGTLISPLTSILLQVVDYFARTVTKEGIRIDYALAA